MVDDDDKPPSILSVGIALPKEFHVVKNSLREVNIS
jgi:hypothetical protein